MRWDGEGDEPDRVIVASCELPSVGVMGGNQGAITGAKNDGHGEGESSRARRKTARAQRLRAVERVLTESKTGALGKMIQASRNQLPAICGGSRATVSLL